MSIFGVFSQSRPSIGGEYFDAVLSESTELITDVTEFPIESGAIGSDHAVQRPLLITMRVGISDNPSRAARAEAGDLLGPLAGNLAGAAIGGVVGQLGGDLAVAAGLGVTAANAARNAGQARTRSQSSLDTIRDIQRRNELINVVGTKREYPNCLITNTRQETNKENEQALELVVEMRQLIIVPIEGETDEIIAPNDPASTQAAPLQNLGLL